MLHFFYPKTFIQEESIHTTSIEADNSLFVNLYFTLDIE